MDRRKKKRYKKNVLDSIGKVWNNKYKSLLVDHHGDQPCTKCQNICKNGLKLGIIAKETQSIAEMDIELTAASYNPRPHKDHSFNEFRSYADNTYKITMAEKVAKVEHVINHEIGHILGLQHPGYRMVKADLANTHAEYAYEGRDINGNQVDGTVDLMGSAGNTGVRDFYYEKWINRLNNLKNGCIGRKLCKYKAVPQ